MKKVNILGIVAAVALAFVVQLPTARADTILVDFTVTGAVGSGWVGTTASPPFGLPLDPTISGSVTLDSTKTDYTAFLAIDWTTGTRVWTLSDINQDNSPLGTWVDWSSPYNWYVFPLFQLSFQSSGSPNSNLVDTGNTVEIRDQTTFTYIYCNGCVEITSVTDLSVVPQVPIPAALPLFASGLAGLVLLGWRRKRAAG